MCSECVSELLILLFFLMVLLASANALDIFYASFLLIEEDTEGEAEAASKRDDFLHCIGPFLFKLNFMEQL